MESASPTTSSETDPLARRFEAWRRSGRKALIPYVTAGHPSVEGMPELLDRLVEAGSDVIELGVPFSDPVADGPTIQRSSQRALENGVALPAILDLLSSFRAKHDTPVVLFTYLNPLLVHGLDRFLGNATSAGADGILISDLPAGADPALERMFEDSPLSFIRLIAPTTPPERALEIARRAQGFLYYVARMGVTGATATLREDLPAEIARLRAETRVPIAVGFGISTPAHAAAVASVADGVVVGSALIDAIDRDGAAGASALLSGFRAAMDAAD
jgi:tryptophan synthase alpha chain